MSFIFIFIFLIRCIPTLLQLFAQVQIIEEDTMTLGDFPRHLNSAFGSMASVFNRRNGRDKQYPSGLSPHVSDGLSQISSVDEFVEEPEDGEQHGQHEEDIIGLVPHICSIPFSSVHNYMVLLEGN